MNRLFRLVSVLSTIFVAFSVTSYADVVPQVHRDIHRELQEQQSVSSFFQTMIDSIETMQGEAPFELYPTLDLYGEWNDEFVPTVNKKTGKIPDSFDIDLTGWCPPIKGRITSPFGWRKRRMHKGQDIKVYVGDTIRAAFDGRVRIRKFEKRGYGYYYVIRHDNGLETIYGHLSKQIVPQDAYVKAGQPIGLGGSTGRSTGPHLHFEMRFMGIALNPNDLINFDTFVPRDSVYHVERAKAELAQNGRSGSKDRAQQGQAGRQSGGNGSASGVHVVRKGDTLGSIARRYGTTVNRLCRLNGLKANSRLQIGKRLRYK